MNIIKKLFNEKNDTYTDEIEFLDSVDFNSIKKIDSESFKSFNIDNIIIMIEQEKQFFYLRYSFNNNSLSSFIISIKVYDNNNNLIDRDDILCKKFENENKIPIHIEFNKIIEKTKYILIEATEIKNYEAFSTINIPKRNEINMKAKKEWKIQEYQNPHLFQIKDDGYYEILEQNQLGLNINELKKHNNEKKMHIFNSEKYQTENDNMLNAHYEFDKYSRIINYSIDDKSDIFSNYIIKLPNNKYVKVYDVLFKKNNKLFFEKEIHQNCFINYIFEDNRAELFAYLQLVDGIFFYSSIDGFFFIKDMEIEEVSKDYRKFIVRPINKNADISYIKNYTVQNITKENVMYSTFYLYNEELQIKKKYNNRMPNIYYYFTMDYSLASYILLYFARKELKITIQENIFIDDGTENYCITIEEDKMELLPTVLYLGERVASNRYNFRWNNSSIYNISCRTIISYLMNELNLTYRSERIDEIVHEISQRIKEKMNLSSDKDVAQFIYDNYVVYADITDNNINSIFSYYKLKYDSIILRNKYNELKEETNNLIDKKRRKWKNEYWLYLLVKKIYPDTEYQYKTEWLGPQSLDIYIPSLKVGIEYQGEQHFSSIDIFGGDDSLERNIKRDETKKYLCMINDVKLIHWSYEEILSTIVVEKKISNILNNNSKVIINYDLIDEFDNEEPGCVSTTSTEIKMDNINKFDKFIAFDVETTGLDSKRDRIIELGAVYFENGDKVSDFGTLVNPKVTIKKEASEINKITNEMIEKAPFEKEAYDELTNYWNQLFSGTIILCAHNAKFDIDFLSKTLRRLGYNAEIIYVDTLKLSRKLIKGLPNYKQTTVAEYFGITNIEEHRAVSDAEVCGKLFIKLLEMQDKIYSKTRRKIIQYDDNMNIINKFNSVSEAARTIGVNDKSIRLAATGQQKHAGGYIWKYENDDFEITRGQIKYENNSKAVIKYDQKMNAIGYYKSIGEASRETGINHRSISAAINGSQRTAGGYIWKLENEYQHTEQPIIIKTFPIEEKIKKEEKKSNENESAERKVKITHWYEVE